MYALLLQLSVLIYSVIAAVTLAAIWIEDVGATAARVLATVTGALTAAGFAKFGKVQNLPASIAALSARHMASKDYIEGSQQRTELREILADILDHIGEKKVAYEQTIVVGYSFGAIVLLDSIFPKGGASPAPVVSDIDYLVTIGCPADFIRKQVPDYFWGRGQPSRVPPWRNVYRPLDVLSSNFRDDQSTTPEARYGIRTTVREREAAERRAEDRDDVRPTNSVYAMPGSMRYGWGRALALEGLRLHAKYFRPIRKGAETPLARVIEDAFAHGPAERAPVGEAPERE
jgi:hypothetical protein